MLALPGDSIASKMSVGSFNLVDFSLDFNLV